MGSNSLMATIRTLIARRAKRIRKLQSNCQRWPRRRYAFPMREISLITGQLHRAIYNLNAEARKEADHKFEAGLRDAPERAVKKVFAQFEESLGAKDVIVRQRTVSLLAKLMEAFDGLPEFARLKSIELINFGIGDDHPLVREGAVESYSLLLGDAESVALPWGPDHESERVLCLCRLLEIAISDVDEVVREAAAIGVGIQKSEQVQKFGTDFLLENCQHTKYRRVCRSIESLAEFPNQCGRFEDEVLHFLSDSDARFRQAALRCCLRLAKLDALSLKLLEGVVRRMFDGDQEVADLADKVARTSHRTLRLKNTALASALPSCSKLAVGDEGGWRLLETELFQAHKNECRQLCEDRIAWKMKLKSSLFDQQEAAQLKNQSTVELIKTLQQRDGAPNSKELGWAVSKFFGQMAASAAV